MPPPSPTPSPGRSPCGAPPSLAQYPDVNHGTVAGKPIREVVSDDAWLDGAFITTVQQRGAEIIKVGPERAEAGPRPTLCY